MPKGPGTYGKRRGRPSKKLKEEAIAASIVDTYGLMAEGILGRAVGGLKKLLGGGAKKVKSLKKKIGKKGRKAGEAWKQAQQDYGRQEQARRDYDHEGRFGDW